MLASISHALNKNRSSGESRDPPFKGVIARQMGPGFRRDCGFVVEGTIVRAM